MEAMLINPRRRRRRKKMTAKQRRYFGPRRRRRAHARANPVLHRRRRRSTRRRVHARRRRHNPRVGMGSLRGGLMGGLKTGGGIVLGMVAANIGTSAILNNVPGVPETMKSGIGKVGAKVLIGGVLLPIGLKMVGQKNLARNVAIGAWVVALYDAWNLYVQPNLPAQLQDYSEYGYTGSQYNEGGFIGAGDDDRMEDTVFGESIYGAQAL